ncbi:RNA polymerase subunit sigma-24 [Actinomadura craniellae]|uniref:RNA polymerase subunit sigma-24 n=1 Tax=Actinomadura craniellae TaxID=2231787 RepID=A0A365H6D8_9ACTN|nr:sigma-70 family RNA polymerase sigma factor [Actinomadura craniellae]RAY14665.1 RNA polymerase subunit sigma-24 [Actinomadura craniellae]
MDDTEETALLVVRCQLGEPEALARLVRRWHVPLWNYLRRMADSTEAADDLAQETWIGVMRGLPRLREPDRFAPWLFTIARRALTNRLREQYARDVPPAVEPVETGADDLVIDRIRLLAGLADLPLLEREVLVLFHLEDLSLQECADVLGVPVGTVKSRLFRARRMLRAILLEKGFHP